MSEFVVNGRDAYGRPIYIEDLTEDEKTSQVEVSEEWQEFSNRFANSTANANLLTMAYIDKLGADSSVDKRRSLLRSILRSGGIISLRTIKNANGQVLLNAGQYEFELRPFEPERQPEPEVVRDKNGKPLSQSQIAWGEMARWSQQASSQEIKERRRMDPAFASFYRLNIEREARETESTQFQLAGQPGANNRRKVTPELISFAEEYRRTPTAEVRKRRNPVFNLSAEQYNKNFEAALAAGLIGR